MLLSTMTGNTKYATLIKDKIPIIESLAKDAIVFYQDNSNIIYNTSINPECATRVVIVNHSTHRHKISPETNIYTISAPLLNGG
jgi:hypothetical protein